MKHLPNEITCKEHDIWLKKVLTKEDLTKFAVHVHNLIQENTLAVEHMRDSYLQSMGHNISVTDLIFKYFQPNADLYLERAYYSLFFIMKGEEEKEIGTIGISPTSKRGTVDPHTVFIDNVFICPEHRQKRYCTKAIDLLTRELKAARITDMLLNHFPANEAGTHLYEGLGFKTFRHVMHKKI